MVSAFSVLAVIAATAQLGILVTLHVLPTKYDPVHDAISDYGVGDYRRYFWAQSAAVSPRSPPINRATVSRRSRARFTCFSRLSRSGRWPQRQQVWAGFSATTPHGTAQRASLARWAGG